MLRSVPRQVWWIILGVIIISFFAVRFSGNWFVGGIFLLFFALPVLLHLKTRLEWTIFAILSLLGFIFEFTSILVGIPYGKFLYGETLGPKFLDLVPFVLPLSWPVLVFSIWSLTYNLRFKSLLAIIFLLRFDLVLDPVAVRLHMWEYLYPGIWYQVPFSNYFGWIITSLIAVTILRIANIQPHPASRLSIFIHTLFWTSCSLWLGLWWVAPIGIYTLVSLFRSIFLDQSRLQQSTI